LRKRGREKEICIAMEEEEQGYGPSIREESWMEEEEEEEVLCGWGAHDG
jgi:hypothetical protein